MSTLIILALSLHNWANPAQPAYFEIETDSDVKIEVFLGKTPIVPGKTYKTPDFRGKIWVRFVVKWENEEWYGEKILWVPVEAGFEYKFKFEGLSPNPYMVL